MTKETRNKYILVTALLAGGWLLANKEQDAPPLHKDFDGIKYSASQQVSKKLYANQPKRNEQLDDLNAELQVCIWGSTTPNAPESQTYQADTDTFDTQTKMHIHHLIIDCLEKNEDTPGYDYAKSQHQANTANPVKITNKAFNFTFLN